MESILKDKRKYNKHTKEERLESLRQRLTRLKLAHAVLEALISRLEEKLAG